MPARFLLPVPNNWHTLNDDEREKLHNGSSCTFYSIFLSRRYVSLAESVTLQQYELVVDGESRIGKYTGNIENGIPEGYGIFVTTNPSGYSWHYIGYWKAGLMHGEGGKTYSIKLSLSLT